MFWKGLCSEERGRNRPLYVNVILYKEGGEDTREGRGQGTRKGGDVETTNQVHDINFDMLT